MPAAANLVHEQSSSTGTSDVIVSAVNGKQRFANAFSTGGASVFDYFISNRDAAEYERGTGHMFDANTLVRDLVIESTNSNNRVNFSAGTKDIVNDVPADRQQFAAGTALLFQQTSAPTGWTKQTTHNDKALRVVSGTASSGGTSAFSTVFGKTATDATTLTTSMIPAHNHNIKGSSEGTSGLGTFGANIYAYNFATDSDGGTGGSHTHGMDIRVQYVDVIIATKD